MTIVCENCEAPVPVRDAGPGDCEPVAVCPACRRAFAAKASDWESRQDAEEWAHHTSLIYDTDEECQAECERLLRSCTVRGQRY